MRSMVHKQFSTRYTYFVIKYTVLNFKINHNNNNTYILPLIYFFYVKRVYLHAIKFISNRPAYIASKKNQVIFFWSALRILNFRTNLSLWFGVPAG